MKLSNTYNVSLEQIEDLERVQNFCESLMLRYNMAGDIYKIIHLIIDELCINIFSYGVIDGTVLQINIEINISNSAISLLFIDNGIAFNPLEVKLENYILELPIDKRPIGGLGLYFVKHFADKLEYNYIDNKNHLLFMKNYDLI